MVRVVRAGRPRMRYLPCCVRPRYRRVRGQAAAVEAVTSAIKRHRLGLASTARPWGVFLFVGATGVGKTELAKALSVELFGTERRMTRFDMVRDVPARFFACC